jgi:hypothetical protein
MRFTDFLKATTLLTAGEATTLAAVAIVAAASKGDTVTIVFALVWWVLAGAIGGWLGRRPETSERIANLLASARSSMALPELRPAAVLLNRLWPLGVLALMTAGVSWIYPQGAAVIAGGLALLALAWRRQEAAVTAIEERDGARFYVVPTSPLSGIKLARTPGYRRPSGNGTGPPGLA